MLLKTWRCSGTTYAVTFVYAYRMEFMNSKKSSLPLDTLNRIKTDGSTTSTLITTSTHAQIEERRVVHFLGSSRV